MCNVILILVSYMVSCYFLQSSGLGSSHYLRMGASANLKDPCTQDMRPLDNRTLCFCPPPASKGVCCLSIGSNMLMKCLKVSIHRHNPHIEHCKIMNNWPTSLGFRYQKYFPSILVVIHWLCSSYIGRVMVGTGMVINVIHGQPTGNVIHISMSVLIRKCRK